MNVKACHLASKFVICRDFVRNLIFFLSLLVLIVPVSRAQVRASDSLGVQMEVRESENRAAYRQQLALREQKKGYLLARADSISPTTLMLFRGIRFDSLEVVWFDDTSRTVYRSTAMDLVRRSESMLDVWDNSGYPFGVIGYAITEQRSSQVQIEAVAKDGGFYRMDSFEFQGFQLHPRSIQWFCGKAVGSPYSKYAIQKLENRLGGIEGFSSIGHTQLGVVNGELRIVPAVRRSAKDYISGFVGLATSATGNPVFTGEATGKFYNMFHSGTYTSFEWRSFKARSQELKINGSLPYLFGTPFILRYRVEFQKYDTLYSIFYRGLQLRLPSGKHSGLLLGAGYTDRLRIYSDVNTVQQTHGLPNNPASKSSHYSLGWEYSNLVLGQLPYKGLSFSLVAAVGTRKFIQDPQIAQILWLNSMGQFENVYDSLKRTGKLTATQYRIQLSADKYLRLKPWMVLKIAAYGMRYQAPVVYFNELERFGGIKNFRGFNEQSIFANEFYMGTVELRFIQGQSAFLGPFYHLGWYKDAATSALIKESWLQGVGIVAGVKTAAGVLHLAWAVGKSGTQSFGLNQSKFHVGLSNTF